MGSIACPLLLFALLPHYRLRVIIIEPVII